MTARREPAYAKINLCLALGGARDDGRHELVTLFQSVGLADQLVISERAGPGADEVICDAVPGPNLVADALAALRAAGWDSPPLRVAIDKRIPVAAGMGGGSADAAAMLRAAARRTPISADVLGAIAAGLGADVPGQLDPGASLGTGAGDRIEPLPDLPTHGVLVLPQPAALSTADVYREADRLGLGRPAGELAAFERELRAALAAGTLPRHLVVNDLAPAARSLWPPIEAALALALELGADQALVCGSGPTAIGIFWGPDGPDRARTAAALAVGRYPESSAADPVRRGTPSRAPNQ